jgi:type IV pilus assembly protein PilO
MASPNINVDLNAWFSQAQAQFNGLNPNEPGQWPALPKALSFVAAALLVLFLGWFLMLSAQSGELDAARNKEETLKQDFIGKLGQAANLAELRNQRTQVQEYVTQLEKQLPGKAEMDALLSDINQAGLGRGLDFELFKPGDVVVKDYYAELPIEIKVSGNYHDAGAFAADVANLSRIVTLHDIEIRAAGNAKDETGPLVMQATARTYRYLDAEEVQTQLDEKKKKAAAGGKS